MPSAPWQSYNQTAIDISELCREGKVKRSTRGQRIVYSIVKEKSNA